MLPFITPFRFTRGGGLGAVKALAVWDVLGGIRVARRVGGMRKATTAKNAGRESVRP